MESGLRELHKTIALHGGRDEQNDIAVDVVAVHDLGIGREEAWIHPQTGTYWLKDLLPAAIPHCRVLVFNYDASPLNYGSASCFDTVQKHAHTLVASLQADRSLEGCDNRPIIFICHGIGGIIVKKALAYSASRTSSQVQHLHSISVSTFAILFFGTPHKEVNIEQWCYLNEHTEPITHSRVRHGGFGKGGLSKNGYATETLETITDQFVPLMKQYNIYLFWAELPTKIGQKAIHIVEESSAAPIFDNTERCGIASCHVDMVRFASANSPNYRTVIAALSRYCASAPAVISHRWRKSLDDLARIRSNEAFELTGMKISIHEESRRSDQETKLESSIPLENNIFFHPPQETSYHFVGRKEASRTLQQAFFGAEKDKTQDTRQKRFIIHGMGGCGKTELCSKFANEQRNKYWGIFTIHAKYKSTAIESFARIGKIGGLEATESAGKHWLSQSKKPWLLIVDNADDPKLDLRALFPGSSIGHVIVTTRNPDFRSFGNVGSLNLKGLEEDEAVDLLLKRADIPKPWDIATETIGQEIGRALGFLALAIVQAGTSIYKKICELKDYLNFHSHYRNTRHMLSLSTETVIENENENIVYSAFDCSIEYLHARKSVISQDAIEILNIVAFYHFEHIRIDILTRALENRRKTLTSTGMSGFREAIIEVIFSRLQPPPLLPSFLKGNAQSLDPYRIRQALHELYALSFINYDGKDATFSLHPLVHAWAKDRLSEKEKAVWSHVALNVLLETVLLPPEDRSDIHAQYRRDLIPHLDVCLVSSPIQFNHITSGFGRLELLLSVPLLPSLLLLTRDSILKSAKCGYVYADRGNFTRGAEYLSMAKNVLVLVLGDHHERTLMAKLGLAGVFWGLGKLEEAIKLQRQVVEARTTSLGPHHKDTLLAMNHLGRSYWLHGHYKEALDLQTVTLERMETTLGTSHSDTLTAKDNLGVTLGSWQRYEESKEIHEEVLRARQDRLGATEIETLETMNNLGMALLDLKKPSQAQEIMIQVVAERSIKLGKEHPYTLWAISNLSKIKTELGQLDEAETLLLNGLEAGKRSLDEDHLGLLMGYGELARVYARQGRLDESEALTVRVLQKIKDTRGQEHPDYVYALFKFAQLLEMRGRYQEMLETASCALESGLSRLSAEHPLCQQIEDQKRCALQHLELEGKSERE